MSWNRLPDSPDPTLYNPQIRENIKGGLMNTSTRRKLWNEPERNELAFTTQHGSFIKKPYSTKYTRMNQIADPFSKSCNKL